MAEVILDLPDDLSELDIDEDTLREALDALAKKKESQAKARERRENMTPAEKEEAAQAAKMRRAKIALQVKYAEDNGYLPSKEQQEAYVAAQMA